MLLMDESDAVEDRLSIIQALTLTLTLSIIQAVQRCFDAIRTLI